MEAILFAISGAHVMSGLLFFVFLCCSSSSATSCFHLSLYFTLSPSCGLLWVIYFAILGAHLWFAGVSGGPRVSSFVAASRDLRNFS